MLSDYLRHIHRIAVADVRGSRSQAPVRLCRLVDGIEQPGIVCPLFKQRAYLAQDLVNYVIGNRFKFFGPSCAQIKRAWLVAAHNAGRLRASTHERYGKACGTGETSSGCDWQNDWNTGQAIEFARRHD